MNIIVAAWLVLALLFFVFTFVLVVGAPYVPTMAAQRRTALDLLDLKPGQTFYELGSGDGALLKDAAERGLLAVGYELNPVLVIVSRLRTRRYGRTVKVHWGNFWRADVSNADGVFVFLMDHFMKRLDAKLASQGKSGLKLVSHAFRVPGRQPAAHKNAMFLYHYPAVARRR